MTDSEEPAGSRGWRGLWRGRWRQFRRRLRALLHVAFGIGADEGSTAERQAASRRGPAVEPTPPRDVFLVAPGTISLLMPGVTRRLPALPGGAARGGETVRVLPFGDFLGPAERDHFSALPPIDRRALDDVDWEALARELTKEA
jgi:hypothetical protein